MSQVVTRMIRMLCLRRGLWSGLPFLARDEAVLRGRQNHCTGKGPSAGSAVCERHAARTLPDCGFSRHRVAARRLQGLAAHAVLLP